MADPASAPAQGTTGQAAAPAVPAATSAPAPAASTDGQGTAQVAPATGQAAPAAPAVEFYDPKQYEETIASLPPEVQTQARALVKQIHADATRKYQTLGDYRQKVEMFDRFQSDPNFQIQIIQDAARAQGYTLTRGQAAQVAAGQQPQAQPWQPESYEEIVARAVEAAEAKIQERFAPVIQNVQKLQKQNIEAQLDGMDPNWRTYEGTMMSLMAKHPTLVNDLPTLYEMSVPKEQRESRAVQAALRKMKDTAAAATVGTQSTVRQSSPTPKKAKTFAEAAEMAKEQIKGG